MRATYDKLMHRIMVLNDHVWERRAPKRAVEAWLNNFVGKVADVERERLHALFWLAQFMYFGSREIRVLLRSMYRDLILCPLICEVRAKSGIKNVTELQELIKKEIRATRFLGVGNPSESGVHLLYYFRQENHLSKDSFIDAVQIFRRDPLSGNRTLRDTAIERYVFLDDICGSGDTAIDYSEELLKDIKAFNANVKVAYYSLFATSAGIAAVRSRSLFAEWCGTVFELDASYRCLEAGSRYLRAENYPDIDPELACKLVREYGNSLNSIFATGYKDSQMLIGFHHNTPDNTLGMIWHEKVHGGADWTPIFRRYPKFMGEEA